MTMRSIEAQFGGRQVQAAELGGGAFLVHAPAQGVFHGARLLENFLEHEVRVFAAHGVLLAEFQIADLDVGGVRAQIQNVEALGRDGGHVVIVEINDLFRVRDDGIGVAGQKILARADADDERRTAPRADDGVGLVGANHRQAVGADDFAQRVADGLGRAARNCRYLAGALVRSRIVAHDAVASASAVSRNNRRSNARAPRCRCRSGICVRRRAVFV